GASYRNGMAAVPWWLERNSLSCAPWNPGWRWRRRPDGPGARGYELSGRISLQEDLCNAAHMGRRVCARGALMDSSWLLVTPGVAGRWGWPAHVVLHFRAGR